MNFIKNQSSIFNYRLLNYLMAGFLLLVFDSAFSQSVRFTTFDDRPACEDSKGVWREYGDACLDWCYPKFDQFSFCSRKVEFGCDCGYGRCWDGISCIETVKYQRIYEQKKAEEDKLLAEAREKRKADFEANQQLMMEYLISQTLANADNANAQNPQDPNAPPAPPNNNLAEFYKNYNSNPMMQNLSNNPNQVVNNSAPIRQPVVVKPAETLEIPVSESPKIPPLFLQQQKAKEGAEAKKLAETKKDDEKKKDTNEDNKSKSEEESSPLPFIPLPN